MPCIILFVTSSFGVSSLSFEDGLLRIDGLFSLAMFMLLQSLVALITPMGLKWRPWQFLNDSQQSAVHMRNLRDGLVQHPQNTIPAPSTMTSLDSNQCISLDPIYSPLQEDVLAFAPYATVPLSLVGSSLVLWAIFFDRKKLLKTVYHRLVFGMTILDWMYSFGMIVLGPWAVPSDYVYGRSGRGNQNTCTAAGVFLTLIFGTLWYSAFLALSFVMTIRWQWKERTIACCMEPFAHLIGSIYIISVGVSGAIVGVINPLRELPGWCWFSDFPPLCTSSNTYCLDNASVLVQPDCRRGETFREYEGIASWGFLIILWGVVVICMVAIVLTVRETEIRLQQYNTTGTSTSLRRTRETAVQALLYILALSVTFAPVSIMGVLSREREEHPNQHQAWKFFFALLTKLCSPLIGFFNSYIYFRKKFSSLTKDGNSLSFLLKLPVVGKWVSGTKARTPTAATPDTLGNTTLQPIVDVDEAMVTTADDKSHSID
mmetsp:Transcript_32178/g.67074  ORF Transcript_32178/g.67074 Transcript_32178/m.67074 type:complete len:487 (-) Transcript_32178:548-2008(-)